MEQTINYPGWEIVREIGTGSYGKVYEIKKEESFAVTENSALKVISIPPKNLDVQSYSEEMGLDEESFSAMVRNQMESITKEFSLMSQLKGNSNIVSYEDHSVVEHKGELGWDIYIRMELLTPLTDYLRNNNSEKDNFVNESFVAKLGTDICKALTVCENHHIVHRDIKPQNIFINKDGNFKLGDFGIAKNVENDTIGTRTGTFNYMAPEVYNNKPYGSSVDIYSLGLVMYWLLNERRAPFLPLFPAVPTTSDVNNALVRRIRGDEIPAPKNGSDTIKRIVLKAIQCDPKRRYLSATEMLKDLTDNYENGIPKANPAKSNMSLVENKMNKLKSIKKDLNFKAPEKQKMKSKKKIIFPLITVFVICLVAIAIGITNNQNTYIPPDLPEIMLNTSVLIGHRETDYLYSNYQQLNVNDQTVEVNVFPKALEMNKNNENVLVLTYTDRYDYEYHVYGTASITGNSLIVSPCEKIDIKDAYPVTAALQYSISMRNNGIIELKYGEYTCDYNTFNETDKGKLVIKGSTDGEMLDNIKSIYIDYYLSDIKSENANPSNNSKCQIVFSDGSYTLDAVISYYSDGDISLNWSKKIITYNGRQEIEDSYEYMYLYFTDNYPFGLTLIDSQSGRIYTYQNEPIDFIEEQ